jgi:hypothetical protein
MAMLGTVSLQRHISVVEPEPECIQFKECKGYAGNVGFRVRVAFSRDVCCIGLLADPTPTLSYQAGLSTWASKVLVAAVRVQYTRA